MSKEKIGPIVLPKWVEDAAAALGKPVEQIALDVHQVATFIEEHGNHAISESLLKAESLPTYFLAPEGTSPLRDGIMFYNSKSDFETGWQVRKKPYWLDVWIERYGDQPGCAQIADDWRRIKAKQEADDAEAAKAKRNQERWARGRFVDFETHQLGQHWAFTRLMGDRLQYEFMHNRMDGGPSQDMIRFQSEVWKREMDGLERELMYRVLSGDLNAKQMLSIDDKKLKLVADMARVHGMDPVESTDHLADWKHCLTLFYAAQQVKAIQFGEAWPTDFEPLNPIPAVPKVVHVRSRDWINTQENERVYIGRNARGGFKDQGYGNPHPVAKAGSNLEAVALFRAEIMHDPDLLAKVEELRGKRVLGCWCKSADRGYSHWHEEDKPCHGDVYVELLSMPQEKLLALIAAARGEEVEG